MRCLRYSDSRTRLSDTIAVISKEGNDAIEKNGKPGGKDQIGATACRRNEAWESQQTDDRLRSSRLPLSGPGKTKSAWPLLSAELCSSGQKYNPVHTEGARAKCDSAVEELQDVQILDRGVDRTGPTIAKEKLALAKQRLKNEAANHRD